MYLAIYSNSMPNSMEDKLQAGKLFLSLSNLHLVGEQLVKYLKSKDES